MRAMTWYLAAGGRLTLAAPGDDRHPAADGDRSASAGLGGDVPRAAASASDLPWAAASASDPPWVAAAESAPQASAGPGGDPAAATRFRYDPADPTPSLGGPLLVSQRAGAYDNRPLEARPDVLTFTSAALEETLELVGPVHATVHMRSELPHFDVFVRLCEVHPDGRSENLCDGLVRVNADAHGAVSEVRVPMWPTARRLPPGHRLRVQVSGGAHPRYARNPGTGEPLGTATELRAGWREVVHEPGRASSITLPGTT
jgi:putative CocE/NonD family hydrolase